MDGSDLDVLDELLHAWGGFGHREHLELTWIYLGRHSTDDAHRAMAAAIRRVAEMHGVADRSLLNKHYSGELLGSDEARRRWLEPDLMPLPSAA